MIFEIPVNITVEAASEEAAEQQLWEFLKYSKKHAGQEYGFVDWEYFEFLNGCEEK